MPSKENLKNASPQFKPLSIPAGRGKGSKNIFQSNAFKAGLAGFVVLLVLIIVWQVFFTGSNKARPTVAADSATSTLPQTTPAPPPMPQSPATTIPSPPPEQPTEQPAQPADQGSEHGQAGQTSAEPSPPGDLESESTTNRTLPPGAEETSAEPQLPEDFSKWNKEDFLRARKENNPNLLEAITLLGENNPGKASVAQILSELLKAPKPSEESTSTSYRTSMTYAQPGLIDAIIYSLGKNGSQAARQTMMQVLSGKLTTDDDRAAVEAVLKTLVQLPSPENDEILLKVLVSPELIRPASAEPGAWQSQELYNRAMDLVRQNASDNLRVKLAEHLNQQGFETNDPIFNILQEDKPANLGAQLVLYQGEDLPSDLKTKLEQSFLNYACQATALTMGLPSDYEDISPFGVSRGGPSGYMERTPSMGRGIPGMGNMPSETPQEKLTDFDYGVHLAKLLWGEPLASLMSQAVADTRSLEKQAPEIILASTLPLDPIRAAMLKMLKKRGGEGPQTLESAGWSDKVITDPGLIVVLKMLPRSRSLRSVPIATGAMMTSRYPSRRSSDMGGAYGDMGQRKEQVELDWIMSLSKMLSAWCNRFEAAAQAQKKASRRGQKVLEPPPEKMDEFDLPQDVKITAAYQLNWPENAPAELRDIKPGALKVQYFRLEQENTVKKAMGIFRRLARGPEVHEMSNGVWLESLKAGSKPNTKRSLDIFITSPDMQQQPVEYPQKEEPTDLQIDILAIEISDPQSG
jgi:hypothetical protein